jgi:hypothetical protein
MHLDELTPAAAGVLPLRSWLATDEGSAEVARLIADEPLDEVAPELDRDLDAEIRESCKRLSAHLRAGDQEAANAEIKEQAEQGERIIERHFRSLDWAALTAAADCAFRRRRRGPVGPFLVRARPRERRRSPSSRVAARRGPPRDDDGEPADPVAAEVAA